MSGILLYGDSFRNPNMFYVSGFLAPDPFFYVKRGGGEWMVVPPLEETRAQKEARVADVRNWNALGYETALDETGNRMLALAATMERLLTENQLLDVAVEPTFPILLADVLRERGVQVHPDANLLSSDRRHKSEEEIEAIAKAQARAEQAVADASEILAESEIVNDSVVHRGVPLTAERLRAELDVAFARDDFVSESMIVAPGPRSSDPHWFGSGPIKPHQPIILDIFPQDRSSRYYGDVTRTVVKGEPAEPLRRMYDSVFKAQSLALDMIRPGVNGRDVHQAVVDSFAEDGYGDGHAGARYIHGTGHGLGLEVHEQPALGRMDVELKEGDVVTVEPGLYDPEVGGVRLEDVVVLTREGNRNLNKLPKELVVP